jgi:hypothetical protein
MNANWKPGTRDVDMTPEATSGAVLAADQAHLKAAIDHVRWERRGWLGRLVRSEHIRKPSERRTKRSPLRQKHLVA